MSLLRRIASGLRALFQKEQTDRELDEELRAYLEMAIEEKMKYGTSRKDATRAVRLERGNAEVAKEVIHTARWESVVETCWQDLRFALRTLRKSPGFTALAVLAMALGIGANTAVFTVVNGVLLRPLPLVQPERLFLISYQSRLGPLGSKPSLPDRDYLEFQRRTHAFERVTTFAGDQVTMTGAGDAVRLQAGLVTSSFFPVLQVSPAMGRTFAPQEERPSSPGVAVLSEGLWRGRFAADPNILGKAITVDGNKRSVIGVMPAGFAFPGGAALWLPLAVGDDPRLSAHRPAFGLLRPSVSQRQAQAELEALVPQLPFPPGDHRNGWAGEVLPLQDLLVGRIRKSLLIFTCADIARRRHSRAIVGDFGVR